jgi:beta-lactamase class A
MMINRRTFLLTASAFAATPAFAKDAPPALLAYERASGGRIGLYAKNLASGAELRWRDTERLVMCSTFKASLAACVLDRVDQGKDRLDAMITYGEKDLLGYAPLAKENLAKGAMSVGDMAKGIVELSDNTFANLLLARIGGPKALTAFWRVHGDVTSRLDRKEPELNFTPLGKLEDTTTPRAMALSLEHLAIGDGLQPKSRDQLVEWMVNCKTGANRLRAGLPASWKIGDKTGNNGKDAAGDIAVAWPAQDRPVVIAAYTRGGKPTPEQLATVFKAIGELVGERLA